MRAFCVLIAAGLIGGALMVAGCPSANAQARIADLDLAKALQGGGHVIVMRHASADPDKGDTDPLNFKNLKGQQPLTEAGKASAKAFGEWLRSLGAPIGEVITSRYNRAYQTAVLAGFKEKDVKASIDVTEGSLVASPNENRRRAAQLKQLTATMLPIGQNRLVITHKHNITQAFGKEWFEVKEGEASIFRVEKGSYSLVARLQIEDWARVAQAAKR
jgi:phosphohistidine phosphatase SixA